jgi:hypothetical protein
MAALVVQNDRTVDKTCDAPGALFAEWNILFCTRIAFQTAGGFDENYYAAEEVVFVAALKRQGRFAILAETVVTSGRKMRAHSFLNLGACDRTFGFSWFPWGSEP